MALAPTQAAALRRQGGVAAALRQGAGAGEVAAALRRQDGVADRAAALAAGDAGRMLFTL